MIAVHCSLFLVGQPECWHGEAEEWKGSGGLRGEAWWRTEKERQKEREYSEVKHYLNEPALNELLISRKKAMIDLREDHLSRCVRSRGRR